MNGLLDASIVIPAFNETRRIGPTVRQIFAHLEGRRIRYEILIVDDGSTDRTGDLVHDLADEIPAIRLIRNDRNRGKGCAVRNGFLNARGRRILSCDADLSTPIEEFDRFWTEMDGGAEVVIGSRAMRESRISVHQPWYRETMGKVFNVFVRVLFLSRFRDTQCGFKLYRREAALAIAARQRISGFAFDVEHLVIAKKCGFRVASLPVRWANNPDTRVHAVKQSLRMLRDLFRIRFYALTRAYGSASAAAETAPAEEDGR
ncbi:MAG: glycosyltransferase family 2 protein [Planctomycetes bacterium]|nr:glycosyltransferase family 2 protein [Planctomycetota bacterium]